MEIGNDEDHEEANMFMTQSTPPLKKHERSPSPEAQPALTVSSKKKEKAQSPQPEEAVTTSKKSKKHKHKKAKAHKGLEQLILDQVEVLHQLAKGNQK